MALFVQACTILCSRMLKWSDLEVAHSYLKQFCIKFVDAYGHKHFTPNMHMHMHLRDCCSDFGSIYGFWCFAFERCNGVLGSFQTNNGCIESQIMKKFIFQQQVLKIKLSTEFQDISDLLNSSNQEKGSLKIQEVGPAITIRLNGLSHFRIEELHSTYKDLLFFQQSLKLPFCQKFMKKSYNWNRLAI